MARISVSGAAWGTGRPRDMRRGARLAAMTTTRPAGSRTHRLVVFALIVVSAVPVGLYALAVSRDQSTIHADTFRSVSTILQGWIATAVLTWLGARAADHAWPGERLDRAVLRMIVPVTILGLIAAWVANRGMFGSNDRFHLVLFPILVVVVVAATRTLRAFTAQEPAPIPPPSPSAPSESPAGTTTNVEADRHLPWSRGVAGLCLAASPILWFVSVMCAPTDELRNAVVIGVWALAAIIGNIGAGYLLDRVVANRGGILLVFGRVIVAAAVVLVVTWPIFSALVTADSSC